MKSRTLEISKSAAIFTASSGTSSSNPCCLNVSGLRLPIMLAHNLTRRLAEVRKRNLIEGLGPDGKSQVTVEYVDGKPKRVHTIVVSTQHDDNITSERIRNDVIEKIIRPVCGNWIDDKTIYHVNPTGRFVIGGPHGDTGLTGRKIIVDTYGGVGAHGGGCFSGKDPSKVDRSATYMARYIAKNIVAAELAEKCEIKLAYAIGVADQVSVMANTKGTGKIPDEKIVELVKKNFRLKPAHIIKDLDLRRPIYRKTAAYGHFGRELPEFTWERTDKSELLKKATGPTDIRSRNGSREQTTATSASVKTRSRTAWSLSARSITS